MSAAVSRRRAGRSESGFALLIVFVLAAVIAISLYMEMPRVAFEKQRDREQMLVDRGLQYRRGIQLYYRKFSLYPTSMDDLETKNNMRFLRHRYKDPMTGKDEWRLIHMGPGGVLTDSLLQKPPDPLKGGQPGSPDASGATASNNGTGTGTGTANGPPNGTGTGAPGTDPNNPNGDPNLGGINFATARRPSDHVPGSPAASASTDPYQQQQQYPGQPGYPPPQQDPSQSQYATQPQYPAQPLYPGQPPAQPVAQNPTGQPGDPSQQQPQQPPDPNNPNGNPPPGAPAQYPPGFFPGLQPGQPGQPAQPGQPLLPGQQYPGQPMSGAGPAGQPLPSGQQYAGQPISGAAPGTPGLLPGQQYAGQPLTGAAPGPAGPGGPNAATNLIQQAIFGPRQPPTASTPAAAAPGSNIAAGSIAGVASKAEGSGIKVFNDHKKYKEWEFIFDFRNPLGTAAGAAAAGNPQNPLGQQQNPSQTGTGTTPTPPATPTQPPALPPATNQ